MSVAVVGFVFLGFLLVLLEIKDAISTYLLYGSINKSQHHVKRVRRICLLLDLDFG
jgi:hypothetical protein